MAEAALDAGQFKRAAEQFQLVLNSEQSTPRLPSGGGNPADAPVEPALQARARVGLGRALWRKGNPAEAAKAFAQFLEISKGSAEAPAVAMERAGALVASGSPADALSAYAQIVAQYPRAREALQAELARARLLARTGSPDVAAKVLERLLSSDESRKGLKLLGESADSLLAEADGLWSMPAKRRKPTRFSRSC